MRRLYTAEMLDLEPHPEGGWFKETWRSEVPVHPEGYPGPRSTCTAIHFLLGAGEQSRWHTVRSTELWLWHSGGPLELETADDGPAPADATKTVVLGPDLSSGQRFQASSRPASGNGPGPPRTRRSW